MLMTSPPAELTNNLWMLGTAEYPVFCFRDGGECAIFEAGVSAVAPIIARQMAALGLAGESVRQVVVTHAHPDHVMGVPVFRKLFPAVTVLASAAAAQTLAVEKAVAFFCKVDRALAASLQAAKSITAADPSQPPTEMRIAVDRVLRDGDAVSVGSARFTVLATPGHTDCSLSFHEAERGVLIISDLTGYYMPQPRWWWPNYFTGYGATLDSIRRVAALKAEVLCLSHNAVIHGAAEIAAYFQSALAATEAYHQRIVDEVGSGKPSRAVAEGLGAEVFAKTQLLPLDFFEKNCALLVKQSLRHVGIREEGGV
jgi:glyoxylase-like metal-dependent hydrolase (beta-lactamase superfamily II)